MSDRKSTVGLYKNVSESHPNKENLIKRIRVETAQKRFLELYSQTANIDKACQILGLARRNVYGWRRNDPDFKKAFEEADALALEVLEDEANRRAMYGVERPVFQNGKLVGKVQEYSDTLLIVLLKARAPQKYKERWSGELGGPDGKPLNNVMNIVHVHSNIPLADDEKNIIQDTSMIQLEESASRVIESMPIAPAQDPLKSQLEQDLEDLL